MSTYAATGMPHGQQDDGQDDGHKFEGAEIDLLGAQIAAEPLGRLGQTEDGAEVDEQGGGGEGGDKDAEAVGGQLLAGAKEEDGRQDDEDANGKDLVGQAAQQDVVGR